MEAGIGCQANRETHSQDTEGRVGEALGRPPLKRSPEGVPDPYQALILDTDKVSHNIRTSPHPKGSGRRVPLGGGLPNSPLCVDKYPFHRGRKLGVGKNPSTNVSSRPLPVDIC
jgi:hypothetical protein